MKNENVILLMTFLIVWSFRLLDAAESTAAESRARAEERSKQLAMANDKWVTRLVGSALSRAVVESPREVKAYLIHAQGTGRMPQRIEGFSVAEGPVTLSANDAAALSKLLLTVDSYAWAARRSCLVDYGARIEFVGETNSVDVLICFDCEELRLFPSGASENLDPMRPELARIFKATFPSSPRVARLRTEPLTEAQRQSRKNPLFINDRKLKWYLDQTSQ